MTEILLSKTGSEFVDDDTFVRGIMGPIGSGKSVLCCNELMRRALEQQPDKQGRRRSRWAVIRNTYAELRDTTMNTFFEWVPEELGTLHIAENTFIIDQPDLYVEVLFRALDKPKDVKKLLSLELTGAFVNEAREVPLAVIEMLTGRVGRYPAMRDGGPTWYGVIMDTNPPDDDHWWHRIFEEDRPEQWKLFRQPSALSVKAENIDNLVPTYYENLSAGKDPEWIKVYVQGQYGFVQDGKAVYPEYVDSFHTASEPIPITDKAIIVGVDFGLTPAAIIIQRRNDGGYDAVQELVTQDMGARQFGNLLLPIIRHDYQGREVEAYGDPAGDQRSQADSRDVPIKILRNQGLPIRGAGTNDFVLRREGVVKLLSTILPTGLPALRISPACKMLRKGMIGGYKYRRVQVSYDERFEDKPYKNVYSHVCEALQYAIVGAGEAMELIRTKDMHQKMDYSQLDKAV